MKKPELVSKLNDVMERHYGSKVHNLRSTHVDLNRKTGIVRFALNDSVPATLFNKIGRALKYRPEDIEVTAGNDGHVWVALHSA